MIYESMFGNTAALARAVARGLEDYGVDVDVADVAAAPPPRRGRRSTCWSWAPPPTPSPSATGARVRTRSARARLRTAPRWDCGSGSPSTGAHPHDSLVPVAFFDSRATAVRRLPGSAAHKASRLAREAGFRRQLGTESFYVDDVNGPLLPGEDDRARAWGRQLAAHLSMRSRVG